MKFRLLSFLFLLSTVAYCQFEAEGYSLENPTFLDATLDNYDIFLTAEWHWHPNNADRKKHMIEYLAGRNSIDVMVVERRFDFGYRVNHFLETGDSLLLKEYLSLDTFYSTMNGVVYDDDYEFYRWLREFTITHNHPIKVVGIDVASFWRGAPILWTFLKFMDSNPELHEPLSAGIEEAKRLMQEDDLKKRSIMKWQRQLELTASNLEITDQDFTHFLNNLRQSVKWSKWRSAAYRENQIAENFRKYIEQGQKVYGQYGMGHVLLTSQKPADRHLLNVLSSKPFVSFTSMLNAQEPYRDRILSIGLVCFDCDRFHDAPGPDIFLPFLTYDDFDRLKGDFSRLPHGTFVDLRNSDEQTKENCQLLLVEFE